VVAQDNGPKHGSTASSIAPQQKLQQGGQHSFEIEGVNVNLNGVNAEPDGTVSAAGMSFTRDVRRAIGGHAGVSRGQSGQPQFFHAQESFSGPEANRVDLFLRNLGINRVSGDANFGQHGTPAHGQVQIAGVDFNSVLNASPSQVSLGYQSPALEEFSHWISGGKVRVAQATVGYDGNRLTFSPTFTTQPVSGFTISATTRIQDIFATVDGRPSLFDSSLAGGPDQPGGGWRFGDMRLFGNHYSLSDQPGSAIMKYDLFHDNRMFQSSIVLGTTQEFGTFIGARSVFHAREYRGQFSPIDSPLSFSSAQSVGVTYYYAVGDLLYQQRAGGDEVVGRVGINRSTFNDGGAAVNTFGLDFDVTVPVGPQQRDSFGGERFLAFNLNVQWIR
jgi:hypothetical protein